MPLDPDALSEYVENKWEDEIISSLSDYIRIPALSEAFDPDWEKNGHIEAAVEHIAAWCRAQDIEGLTVEINRIPGRTPLIYMEVPGTIDENILLYQHLDKQPEFVGWHEGLGPWTPVRRGDKLYGRGGADDGYGAYASLTAIKGLQLQGIPHANLKLIVEASEESGSPDLPSHLMSLADRIGTPSLVVCLDSGAGDWDHLWLTTSLRGVIVATLDVAVSSAGVHSGDAGGIIPSSFRIARNLLDRISDSATGKIILEQLWTQIPQQRIEQAEKAALILGDEIHSKFPLLDGVSPNDGDLRELILNRTWRPAFEVTGVDGAPACADGGNTLRTNTKLKLSIRIPAGVDCHAASELIEKTLTENPPQGAHITFDLEHPANGFHAKPLSDWMLEALEVASSSFFGKSVQFMGEGGTIPFMPMLQEQFPSAEFMITGILGPESNAHGPNEFTHIPCAKSVTCCVAQVIACHHQHHS
ncbi:MAG TPA: M20/M25/M40 family metallo-hydrolase [Candidatus Poseidoniales archaeon]|jgi:acetylornithine deacetylase/succinyl-diaminopimelate desuccinylase-like protein|nr:MAG: peptidase M20 [Euryarchaeota archaeon]HIF46007.1 M20/M25/M40 family metallo-hydrolase [Candidatus Poseidoniales archaeon]HIL65061.1 M20/M25/M40 family metallo-hydrolase [Candidatus Poseidoniales archaeon]